MLRHILKIEQNLAKRSTYLTWNKLNSTMQQNLSLSINPGVGGVQQEEKTTTLPDAKKKQPATFAQMFKESQFVSLGNLENKFLVGRIVEVVGNDLYIDYGGKFNCVCKIPETVEGYSFKKKLKEKICSIKNLKD